jgi:hypothetical protein
MWVIQPPIEWMLQAFPLEVKPPEREAEHFSLAKVKNTWSCI